jgi:hypothetical protein
MKSFYSRGDHDMAGRAESDAGCLASYIDVRARIAVYDGPASAPLIEEVPPAPVVDYVETLSAKVFDLARGRGGNIPYTVIRELVENFIHSGFAEPVVSVMESGRTIRFSDQGPGIADKERALQPGFTTASSAMKTVIRGVGSGLPIVRDFLDVTGGRLSIEDNLARGAVVTISAASPPASLVAQSMVPRPEPAHGPTRAVSLAEPESALFSSDPTPTVTGPWLTTRQKQVLALVLESGSAGPSIVSRELGVGLSTAYRDLACLEEMGLIASDGGKRTLTPSGMSFLGDVSSSTPTRITRRDS